MTTIEAIETELAAWARDRLRGLSCAVTGAAGFTGAQLIVTLLSAGVERVHAIDRRNCADVLAALGVMGDPRIVITKCEITSPPSKMFEGVDCVFHVASYFGSPEFARRGFGDDDEVEKVNVTGTHAVLDACMAKGVSRLVYCSTVNVIFDGKNELVDAPEEIYPPAKHEDAYSRTKMLAEDAVLRANGVQGLYTTSVRPNMVWGSSLSCKTVVKVLRFARWMGGIYAFMGSRGERKSLSDTTHVLNLVKGMILAAQNLDPRFTDNRAAGQAFHITDGKVGSNMEFVEQFYRGLDFVYRPIVSLPPWVLLPTVLAMEHGVRWYNGFVTRTCGKLAPSLRLTVPLTSPEIRKVCVTHYFSIKKARELLGYEPVSVDRLLPATISWYKEQKTLVCPAVTAVNRVAGTAISLAMLLLVLCCVIPVGWLGNFHITTCMNILNMSTRNFDISEMDPAEFQTRVLWSCLFVPAVIAHCLDGMHAFILALRRDSNACGWMVQTMLFGYPSLRLLDLSWGSVGVSGLSTLVCFLLAYGAEFPLVHS